MIFQDICGTFAEVALRPQALVITQRPPLTLSGGARLAVWVIVNVEEWNPLEPMPGRSTRLTNVRGDARVLKFARYGRNKSLPLTGLPSSFAHQPRDDAPFLLVPFLPPT